MIWRKFKNSFLSRVGENYARRESRRRSHYHWQCLNFLWSPLETAIRLMRSNFELFFTQSLNPFLQNRSNPIIWASFKNSISYVFLSQHESRTCCIAHPCHFSIRVQAPCVGASSRRRWTSFPNLIDAISDYRSWRFVLAKEQVFSFCLWCENLQHDSSWVVENGLVVELQGVLGTDGSDRCLLDEKPWRTS